jgi:hypothetical protein
VRYGLSNEQLAMRLVELLAERTTQNGRIFSRWATLPEHGDESSPNLSTNWAM